MEFKKVTILGGGVLGTQIAMQSAYCGKEVTMWLRSEDSRPAPSRSSSVSTVFMRRPSNR